MIALLLATQIAAAAPPPNFVAPKELLRSLPARQACMTEPPGRAEVALKTTPSALYRQGDRPAKPYLRWADYPDGAVCAVGAGR